MRTLWMVALAACSVDDAMYGSDWWAVDPVGMVQVVQDRPDEATFIAEFWAEDRPPAESVPEPGDCTGTPVASRPWWSPLTAGPITLDAGGGQQLRLTHDDFRYRLDATVPVAVAPRVRFAVTAEGGDVAAFTVDPGLSMPRAEVSITGPEPAVDRTAPFVIGWTGSDPYARVIVRVQDRWGNQVWCALAGENRLRVSLDEPPWTTLQADQRLEVEVERRRTRFVDLPEGPLKLQTAYIDRLVLPEPGSDGGG